MIENLRFELSFRTIFELEKKLNFCLSNNIHKINIPCKGIIKKKFLYEAVDYIHKNYSELEVVYHYSLYHQFCKNRNLSYSNFIEFLENCSSHINDEILLISGSNKRKNFEVVGVMNDLKQEKIKDINIGIAYNPYLKKHYNLCEERERFEKKFSTGLISSIWLQFGTDISLLEYELDYLKKYIEDSGIYDKNKNIKIFGSLLIPSRQFIARFRFRPWKEVFIEEKYLSSLNLFESFIKDLITFYIDNCIHPVIETECASINKLEQIHNYLKK